MQSIGERLEEARKRKGVSIREAAEATKIRSDYLHKFEGNQYDINLPEIYVRGFLRSYASYLKLPADKIIADYNASNHTDAKAGSRTMNREVYGRMDISTSKETKLEEAGPSGSVAPSTSAGDSPASAAPAIARNPATFIPPAHASGSPLDKKLLTKIGVIAVATIVILVLIIAIVSRHGGAPARGTAQTSASANSEIWIRPQAGERTFDIVARNGPVAVRVTSDPAMLAPGAAATIYYQGTISAGEKRTLGRSVQLRLEASPYGNLQLVFDGTPYQISGPQVVHAAP